MLTLELLETMLHTAAIELKEQSTYLCELDSVAGDGDHGITIGRMADAMKQKIEAHDAPDIKELLDDLSMLFMTSNGGSAGPLWGTVFGGFAEGVEAGKKELTIDEMKAMFAQAKKDFADISQAKVGDKTMVDALYPALDAISVADGTIKEIMFAAAKAASEGAEKTAGLVAKFGRAKNIGERSIGTKDPGAVSIAVLFNAMAKVL